MFLFKEYMHQQKFSSPKLIKATHNLSSPTLDKDKLHLPSRYALDSKKKDSNILTLLSTIELNARQERKLKLGSPSTATKNRLKLQAIKTKQSSDFKQRPIKREESDMLNFKQIFLEPRQQILHQIRQESKSDKIVLAKQMCKDYQKLLHFQKGASQSPTKQKQDPMPQNQLGKLYQQAIELLQKPNIAQSFLSFYDQQFRIQPPEAPNSSIASTISLGASYAPSVPLLPSKKGTLGELLMKAKAGMAAEDIQKEAHLAFYLGMVYEQKRAHHSAVKFYKRYLGFAKTLQDKIGMALGANRVAVNLYYNKQPGKSIAFHHENLKLSDKESCFAAYYNLGLCHRALNQSDQAISSLETALEWSRQHGDAQRECICLGQLAMTYKAIELYQKSIYCFEQSAEICRRLKKTELLAENLQHMLLIMSNFGLSSFERQLEVANEAYECAKLLQKENSKQWQACNIGIIKGYLQFKKNIIEYAQKQDIQQFQIHTDGQGSNTTEVKEAHLGFTGQDRMQQL